MSITFYTPADQEETITDEYGSYTQYTREVNLANANATAFLKAMGLPIAPCGEAPYDQLHKPIARLLCTINSTAQRGPLLDPDFHTDNFFHTGRDHAYIVRTANRLINLLRFTVAEKSTLIWS